MTETNYQFSSSKMQYKIYHQNAAGVRFPLCQNSNYNFRWSVMSLFCSFIISELFSYFTTAKSEKHQNKCETEIILQSFSHYYPMQLRIENTQKVETQQIASRSSEWIGKCHAESFWQHQRHHRWPPMPQIAWRPTLMHWRKTQIWNAFCGYTTECVRFFTICSRFQRYRLHRMTMTSVIFNAFRCTSTRCVASDEGLFGMSHMMSTEFVSLMYGRVAAFTYSGHSGQQCVIAWRLCDASCGLVSVHGPICSKAKRVVMYENDGDVDDRKKSSKCHVARARH